MKNLCHQQEIRCQEWKYKKPEENIAKTTRKKELHIF